MPFLAYTPARAADEVELKATFVLNFLRMVNWTASDKEADRSKLNICALNHSELFGAIRGVARGTTISGRSLGTVVTSDPSPSTCRVLFFENSQYARAADILKRFENSLVLTIGNGPGFLTAGGMFELIVHDRRVQFNVAVERIRRSKLEVSARLLRLARNVQKDGADGI